MSKSLRLRAETRRVRPAARGTRAGDSPGRCRRTATPHASASPLPTPGPKRTPRPTPTLGPPHEIVCPDKSLMVTGPPGTKWNLERVQFRTYRDLDRVIYELRRTGEEDDDVEPVARVRHSIPGDGEFVGAPPWTSGSDWHIDVLLVNGIRDRARLDPPYEPRGMRVVNSLSTQRYRSHVHYYDPAEDPYMVHPGTYSTVDVIGQGCFDLRVVGWDGDADNHASAYVDIRH